MSLEPSPGFKQENPVKINGGQPEQGDGVTGSTGSPRAAASCEEEHLRLARRERSFTALFNGLPFPLALQGIDGRYLLVNSAFCDLAGKKREEIIGNNSAGILPPPDVPEDGRRFAEAMETGQSIASGYEMNAGILRLDRTAIRNASGRVIAVLSHGTPGSVPGGAGTVLQVLKGVIERSSVPKALYDETGTLVASHPDFWKQAAKKGLPVVPLRTLPKPLLASLHSGADPDSPLTVSLANAGETGNRSSVPVKGIYQEVILIPVRSPGKKKIMAVIAEFPVDTGIGSPTVADLVLAPSNPQADTNAVSSRLFAATTTETALVDAVLETHPGVVLFLSGQGRILDYSGGIMTTVLFGREDLKKTSVFDLLSPASRDQFSDFLDRVRTGSPREEGVVAFGAPGEERVFTVTCVLQGPDEIVCTLIDRTHEREVESKAVLYHDLIALDLSAWISEVLRDTSKLYSRVPTSLSNHVRQMIGHIRRCVDVTRAFSASEKMAARPPGLRSIPLDRIIQAEIANFPDLSIRYNETRTAVMGDDTLSDVIWFVLANAARYAGPGARILIEVYETRGMAEIRITDTGPGIPRELKEELLSPRSTSEVHGLPRGLALTRVLVERMGGRVRVRDRAPGPGARGTVISIYLKEGPSPVRSFPL